MKAWALLMFVAIAGCGPDSSVCHTYWPLTSGDYQLSSSSTSWSADSYVLTIDRANGKATEKFDVGGHHYELTYALEDVVEVDHAY